MSEFLPSSYPSRLAGTLVAPERMSGLRLAVVGLGALGSEVVRILGLCGAGEVLLVDPDSVEASNLTRSVLCTSGDIGRPKAEVLVERLRERCPGTRWHGMREEIADVGWGRIEHCHLVFGCVDRDSARLEMARISTRLGVPVCDGGLGGAEADTGRVSYFPGSSGACFGCRLTAARRGELLRHWQSQPHPCAAPGQQEARASTPLIVSVVAGTLVDAGLRAMGSGEAFSIDIRLAPCPTVHRVQIVQSELCPFHSSSPSVLLRVPTRFADLDCPVGWEWPICTAARCLACGEEWAPFERVARVRGQGRCPQCGAGRILVLHSIRAAGPDSPWASKRPVEIGLPEDHRYTKWGL